MPPCSVGGQDGAAVARVRIRDQDAVTTGAGGLALEPSEYTLETVVDRNDDAGATTAVTVLPGGEQVKALELSGVPGLLFRRNSVSGAVEVIARDGRGVELNEALH